jgi:hypothetical protein
MKAGDLVKIFPFQESFRAVSGVIVRFDEDGDPVILDFKTKVQCQIWKDRVEVINESR